MITVDPQTRRLTYQPEFHLMKHFARFIEPGAGGRGGRRGMRPAAGPLLQHAGVVLKGLRRSPRFAIAARRRHLP
jgi:hypothetical protein